MAATIPLEKRRRNLFPNEAVENKEDIQLIWLDENLDDSSDCLRTQSMLLELNSAAQFYSDFDRCINLIKLIKDERVFLIISSAFARSFLAQISTYRTLIAIFIFCTNSQQQETSTNKCDKVVGIFTDQDGLFKSIREEMNLVEKQTLAFSLFDQKQRLGRDLSKESASFIWHQMLIYVLKQIPQNQQSKDEMLNMCRHYYRNNKRELKKIEDFQVNYTSNKAIEWYTDECFLYKLLNKALRTEDIELLHTFRFFIIDLCAALEKESLQLKSKTILTTFHGTRIPSEELKKLKENEGKIISTNGFLSTSRNINVSLAFAGQTLPAAVFQAVLFEIEADPSLKAVVYADIEKNSRMKGEDEVLFALNALFKIGSVTFDSILNIWRVKLVATDEGTEKVQEHITSIKQRLDEYPPIIYFGRLLIKELGQVDRADKYFEMLLKSLPSDHADIAAVYNQIGNVHDRRGDLNSALKNFKLAYEIGQKQLVPNYQQLAGSLGNIGRIHRSKGNFDQALDCYRQVLDIGDKNYPGDHIHKAIVIESIGVVLGDKNDFDTAFVHLFDGLGMLKGILPAQHPYIARYFGYIGYVHEKKGELDRALDYYHQLLKMDEQCLAPDHPDHSIDLEMIVGAYKKLGQTEKALELCRKKLNDQKNTLGETHSCISRTLISMADVLKEENPNQALNYYKQALSALEQSKSPDHRAISQCLTSIGCLYWRQDMIDDALQCELQAFNLYQQNLSPDHTKIANSLRNLGIYYRCKNNPSEALRYFNESLSIYRANYKSDHEDVKRIEADIVELNCNLVSTTNTEPALRYANETVPRTLVITTINDRQRPYAIPYTTVSHHYSL
jgi:tetratricopeptide (TPR) repeat protein